MIIKSVHCDFYESWIYESPMGAFVGNPINSLSQNIKAFREFYPTVNINNGFKKCEGEETIYYWFENDGNIILAVEATKSPQAIKINLTGKNKNFNSPYASKLYAAILHDQHKPIRVVSDETMSNDGLKIWKNLIRDGFTIGIYDNQAPGRTYQKISSSDDLDQYFKHNDTSYKRYQYIISEKLQFLELMAKFNLRRFHELAGSVTDDYYKTIIENRK
jgi:hypothetical protein